MRGDKMSDMRWRPRAALAKRRYVMTPGKLSSDIWGALKSHWYQLTEEGQRVR